MFTKRVRKLAAFIVSFAMVTGILPLNMVPKGFGIIPERAEAAETVGDFTIEGDTGYSYEGNVLTIGGSGEYTVAMASVGTTTNTDTIRVTSTEDVTITLDSVLIENSSRSPFEINATGDVTLKLKGESIFTAKGDDYAGLQKTSTDNELIITSAAGDGSTEGKLTATGGYSGAGIGGGRYGSGSNITISGGTVTATSHGSGAGIGGGRYGSGSNITIRGGTVTSTSNVNGAGIGGGDEGGGSNITISGGEVTSTSSQSGAGIGGGWYGSGSNITISGGEVTARSNQNGAGIGGGNAGGGSNITISGGYIEATGGRNGAGIGGGSDGDGSNITIEGGTVTATSDSGAGIGGGSYGGGSNITIEGGTVTATSDSGAGIGGGDSGSGSDITISGGEVTATSNLDGAGIGGGYAGAGSDITIEGGNVTATGGENGAGIGGGYIGDGSDITIRGGTVTATSNGNGAGIGGGRNGSGSSIYISPDERCTIYAKYAEEDEYTAYTENTEITDKATGSTYFSSRDYDEAGAFAVRGDSNGYSYSGGVLTISGGGEYTIGMASVGTTTTTDTIRVTSDSAVTITLDSVLIKNSSRSPFEIDAAGDVTLKLKGESEFTATGSDYAGLQKTSATNKLIITSAAGDGSTEGWLTATGDDYGAGIGGGRNGNGSNITIEGGNVTATGGFYGAGIGGGSEGSGSNITIEGGNVTATANGDCGAGIGGGYRGSGSNITIEGGTVTATSSEEGAGIGGGWSGNGSNITISGGTVTATGNVYGAGIGGGYRGSGSDITIEEGNVTATGGENGAGIGGGYRGSGSNITISGGTVTATSAENGAGIGDGYSGSGSENIYISPNKGSAIYAKYAENGVESLYTGKTDITANAAGSTEKYFHSYEAELPINDHEGVINAGDNSLIIADDDAEGTNIYIDADANGIIDETDTLIATGNLTNADISTTGSIVTVSGGSIGTLTGDVNNTAVYIMGAPKVTIDLSTVKENAVNVTGALTDATGNIKLTGVTAGSTVANVSNSAYMTIDDSNAIDKAFSGEGVTFVSYTTDNTVKALSGDESYTLSLKLNGEVTDFNPGDEIKADVVVSGGAVAIGSVQFELAGDWFTLESATSTSSIEPVVNKDTKSVSITGLNVNSGDTAAKVRLKVNSNISTTENAAIGFAETGNYVTPVNSGSEITPSVQGTTVNLHNITVTFVPGNAVFDGDETMTEAKAYVKYNTAGLYADAAYTTAFTMPALTAKTGYRLADGTAENMWSDGTNGYLDNDAVTNTAFTENVTLTAQTVKQCTVTINPADSSLGSISGYTSPVTVEVDENTKLSDVVNGIIFTPAVEDGYALTGWSIENGNVVYNANLEKYSIAGDITITPYIEAINYKVNAINATKATVSSIAEGDTVTYGKDVTFTVNTEDKATVYSVYYTVGNGQPVKLTGSNGSYTIPGSEILGDLSIEAVAKTYYTIEFSAGEGNTMTTLIAYAWEGVEGLYSSIEGLGTQDAKLTADSLKAGLSATKDYRLAADTADEPLWSSGTAAFTGAALAEKDDYTADTAYTAVSVRQYDVDFTAGENGSLTGTTEYKVDTGKSLTALPTPVPDDNYSFKNWDINGTDYTDDELKALAITADTTVTAEFEPSKYNISFAESSVGEFGNISGVVDDKAAYLTNVSFTFTPNENYRIDSVYYTVNGEKQNDIVDNGGGSYTIPGSSITGDVSVTVETQETRTFVFATAAGENKGSLSGTTSFIIDIGEYLTAEQLEEVGTNAKPGYSFTGWMIDDTISGQAVVVPTEVPADRDITFYAQFDYTDFNVNDNNNASNIISGLENGYAHLNTDIEFEIKDSIAVTYVGYSIGDGEAVKLTADDKGNYTIPGSVITGDVNIVTNVVPGSGFTFISKEDYIGEAINAFDSNRKIAVLDADKLESGNYALTNGREFFWSERYESYVMIVDAGEKAKTMNAKLTINENGTLRPVDYSGDLNGTDVVTAGDGGMLNDILGNTWSYVVTDSQLFMLDVEGNNGDAGYQKAMTSDIVWILKESLGLNDNE